MSNWFHQCHHAGTHACMLSFCYESKRRSVHERNLHLLSSSHPSFLLPPLLTLTLTPLSPSLSLLSHSHSHSSLTPLTSLPLTSSFAKTMTPGGGWGGGCCHYECTRHVIPRHLMSHHATLANVTKSTQNQIKYNSGYII